MLASAAASLTKVMTQSGSRDSDSVMRVPRKSVWRQVGGVSGRHLQLVGHFCSLVLHCTSPEKRHAVRSGAACCKRMAYAVWGHYDARTPKTLTLQNHPISL